VVGREKVSAPGAMTVLGMGSRNSWVGDGGKKGRERGVRGGREGGKRGRENMKKKFYLGGGSVRRTKKGKAN